MTPLPFLFADKGLISADLTDQLAGRGVDLTTPLRANMKDDRPPWLIRQAMRLRRGIETACLVEDFGVLRNKGRDFWRWSARFLRKVLAYNLSLRFERTFARA